jgi:predicted amidohydrolase YtcJ
MPNPDLILHNGTIYPRVETPHAAQAIAVWNGLVTAVGASREILSLKGRGVATIDLRQRTVIPGLSDSHIHLLGYGMLLRGLDLSGARSIKDIQSAVNATVRGGREGWILGRGWDQEKFLETRYPRKEDFSATLQPVFLRRVCGHVAIANARALSLAGVGKDTLDPKDGVIERDPSSGEPTGLLKESAIGLVQQVVPLREDDVEEALYSAAKRLLRVGLTSLHCIIENALELKVLRRLKSQGKIRQSIYGVIPLSLLNSAAEMGLSTEPGRPGFRIGGVKMFLDGSLGARTAALTEPYSDDPSSGMLTLGGERLYQVAEKAVEAGFQLSMHAIGDRAVEEAVKTVEKVGNDYHGRKLRHRIEHASIATPGLIARFRKNGIVASVQPGFVPSDTWAEKRLGTRRIRYLYPFKSLTRAGVRVAAGSDCPVEDPNPFRGVWAAVERPGLPASERLGVNEALACYTTGAAYASFAEEYQGALEPGMVADMLVLDRDPFKSAAADLNRTRVLQSFVAGEAVLKQRGLEALPRLRTNRAG